MLLIGIESEVGKTKLIKHCLYHFNIIRRTKPIPSPTLKVSSTPEMPLKHIHKYLSISSFIAAKPRANT